MESEKDLRREKNASKRKALRNFLANDTNNSTADNTGKDQASPITIIHRETLSEQQRKDRRERNVAKRERRKIRSQSQESTATSSSSTKKETDKEPEMTNTRSDMDNFLAHDIDQDDQKSFPKFTPSETEYSYGVIKDDFIELINEIIQIRQLNPQFSRDAELKEKQVELALKNAFRYESDLTKIINQARTSPDFRKEVLRILGKVKAEKKHPQQQELIEALLPLDEIGSKLSSTIFEFFGSINSAADPGVLKGLCERIIAQNIQNAKIKFSDDKKVLPDILNQNIADAKAEILRKINSNSFSGDTTFLRPSLEQVIAFFEILTEFVKNEDLTARKVLLKKLILIVASNSNLNDIMTAITDASPLTRIFLRDSPFDYIGNIYKLIQQAKAAQEAQSNTKQKDLAKLTEIKSILEKIIQPSPGEDLAELKSDYDLEAFIAEQRKHNPALDPSNYNALLLLVDRQIHRNKFSEFVSLQETVKLQPSAYRKYNPKPIPESRLVSASVLNPFIVLAKFLKDKTKSESDKSGQLTTFFSKPKNKSFFSQLLVLAFEDQDLLKLIISNDKTFELLSSSFDLKQTKEKSNALLAKIDIIKFDGELESKRLDLIQKIKSKTADADKNLELRAELQAREDEESAAMLRYLGLRDLQITQEKMPERERQLSELEAQIISLTPRRNDLLREIQERERRFVELRDGNQGLEEELVRLKSENASSLNRLQNTTRALEDLESQIGQAKLNLESLDTKLRHSSSRLDVQDKKERELEKNIPILEQNTVSRSGELASLQRELEQNRTSLYLLSEEIESRNRRIQELDGEEQVIRDYISTLDQQKQSLQDENSKLQEVNRGLKTEQEDKQRELQDIVGRTATLEDGIKGLEEKSRTSTERLTELQRNISDQEERFRLLSQQLSNSSSRLEQQSKAEQSLQDSIRELEQNIVSRSGELASLQRELEQNRTSLDSLIEEIENSSGRILELVAKEKGIRDAIGTLDQQKQSLQDENLQLQQELRTAQSELDDLSKIKSRFEEENQRLEALNEGISSRAADAIIAARRAGLSLEELVKLADDDYSVTSIKGEGDKGKVRLLLNKMRQEARAGKSEFVDSELPQFVPVQFYFEGRGGDVDLQRQIDEATYIKWDDNHQAEGVDKKSRNTMFSIVCVVGKDGGLQYSLVTADERGVYRSFLEESEVMKMDEKFETQLRVGEAGLLQQKMWELQALEEKISKLFIQKTELKNLIEEAGQPTVSEKAVSVLSIRKDKLISIETELATLKSKKDLLGAELEILKHQPEKAALGAFYNERRERIEDSRNRVCVIDNTIVNNYQKEILSFLSPKDKKHNLKTLLEYPEPLSPTNGSAIARRTDKATGIETACVTFYTSEDERIRDNIVFLGVPNSGGLMIAVEFFNNNNARGNKHEVRIHPGFYNDYSLKNKVTDSKLIEEGNKALKFFNVKAIAAVKQQDQTYKSSSALLFEGRTYHSGISNFGIAVNDIAKSIAGREVVERQINQSSEEQVTRTVQSYNSDTEHNPKAVPRYSSKKAPLTDLRPVSYVAAQPEPRDR
jgi:chromosome segregation ATPase